MNSSDRIKLLLRLRHKSVDDLAEAVGKDRTTIYRYLNGQIENMPRNVVDSIAKFLSTSPSYIMGWEDDDQLRSEFAMREADPSRRDMNAIVGVLSKMSAEERSRALALLRAAFPEYFDK